MANIAENWRNHKQLDFGRLRARFLSFYRRAKWWIWPVHRVMILYIWYFPRFYAVLRGLFTYKKPPSAFAPIGGATMVFLRPLVDICPGVFQYIWNWPVVYSKYDQCFLRNPNIVFRCETISRIGGKTGVSREGYTETGNKEKNRQKESDHLWLR